MKRLSPLRIFCAVVMLFAAVLVGSSSSAIALNCATNTWPGQGDLQLTNSQGSNAYSASFRFTLSPDELCSLQAKGAYVEIDYDIYGFDVASDWEAYTLGSTNLPGAIHDVGFNNPNYEPNPAITRIYTSQLVAGIQYYSSISWSANVRSGYAPTFVLKWTPSYWARSSVPYENTSCTGPTFGNNQYPAGDSRNPNEAWCIFPHDPDSVIMLGAGTFASGYTNGVIPLTGTRWVQWNSGTMISSPVAIGDGASTPVNYYNQYMGLGGGVWLGAPQNSVHSWGPGCAQDLLGGSEAKGALMSKACSATPYAVSGSFWAYFEAGWGSNASATVGYPYNNRHQWGNGLTQDFDGGTLNHAMLMRGNAVGSVYLVFGGNMDKYISYGGATGFLGYPINAEYTSGSNKRQDFEGGSLSWNASSGSTLIGRTVQGGHHGAKLTSTGANKLLWYNNGNNHIDAFNWSGNALAYIGATTGIGTPTWATTGDMDGDGVDELLWYNNSNNHIDMFKWNGSSFTYWTTITGMGTPTWAATANIDGTGAEELLWYNAVNNNLDVFRWNGSGLTLLGTTPNMGNPGWALTGNVTGNGKDQLVWYDPGTTKINLFEWNGASFTYLGYTPNMGQPYWAGLAKFDTSGQDYLMWYDATNSRMNFFKYDGSTFVFQTYTGGIAAPAWAGVEDLDGSNINKLVWYTSSTAHVDTFGWNGGGLTYLATTTGIGGPTWALNGVFVGSKGSGQN